MFAIVARKRSIEVSSVWSCLELWFVDDCLFMFGYLEEVKAIGKDSPRPTATRPCRVAGGRGIRKNGSADPGYAARSGANCFDPDRDQESFQNIFSVEPTQNLVGTFFPEGTSILNLF